jgi:hypothetical protein
MPIEKARTKNAQRRYVYAILLSLILLLPVAEAATTIQPKTVTASGKSARAENLSVIITQPLPDITYFQGKALNLGRNNSTFVYGPLTIKANVTGVNITKVDFYIDGVLKGTDNASPYEYNWTSMLSINLKTLSLKHNITVVAYDASNLSASANITVSKWRFHIAPLLLMAGAMVPLLIPRTTIRGLVFNMHKNLLGYSFFALRVHYKSVSILKKESGTIFMKRVRVGPALSFHTLNISPLKLTRISSTFLGTFN